MDPLCQLNQFQLVYSKDLFWSHSFPGIHQCDDMNKCVKLEANYSTKQRIDPVFDRFRPRTYQYVHRRKTPWSTFLKI